MEILFENVCEGGGVVNGTYENYLTLPNSFQMFNVVMHIVHVIQICTGILKVMKCSADIQLHTQEGRGQ